MPRPLTRIRNDDFDDVFYPCEPIIGLARVTGVRRSNFALNRFRVAGDRVTEEAPHRGSGAWKEGRN